MQLAPAAMILILGVHYITLYPAINRGNEKRPINFRQPQLTYEADHPGEDLPRLEFASTVTTSDTN